MKKLLEAVRHILSPEKLEDLPMRHIDPFRRDLLSWLFGREALPQDAAPAGRTGPGFLAWLLAPEELSAEEPRPEALPRRRFLGGLFAGEELPAAEEPGAPGAGRGRRPG